LRSGSGSGSGTTSSYYGYGHQGHQGGQQANAHVHVRGRTTSSAFTVKGEVRPNTDLVVMEVVVDSRMFGGGGEKGFGFGYKVDVRARRRAGLVLAGGAGERRLGDAVALSGLGVGGDAGSTSTTPSTTTTPSSSSSSFPSTSAQEYLDLPFIYTIHTMPSSPLHSSGLSADAPSRHLLRLSLPTAQYRVSSVRDPLTGEMRGAKPKPAWLEELEKEGGGVVVEVIVSGVDVGEKDKDKDVGVKDRRSTLRVWVNAGGATEKEVKVVGEKESLTNLGREELLDDRKATMGVLSRWVYVSFSFFFLFLFLFFSFSISLPS